MRGFSKVFWGCVIALTMFCEVSSGLFNVKPLRQRLSPMDLYLLGNCLAENTEAGVLNEHGNVEKIRQLSFFNRCLSVYEGKVIIDFWKEGVRDYSE